MSRTCGAEHLSSINTCPMMTRRYKLEDRQHARRTDLAGSLLQVISGICVFQLNGLDPAKVIEISAILSMAATLLRSLRLGPKLLSLLAPHRICQQDC